MCVCLISILNLFLNTLKADYASLIITFGYFEGFLHILFVFQDASLSLRGGSISVVLYRKLHDIEVYQTEIKYRLY